MARRGEARGRAAAGPGDAVQVDVVRHLAVGMVLEMELDRVALAHADEAAGHRAAEGPERVLHAFGDLACSTSLHFELDDDLGRVRCGRWAAARAAGLVSTALTGSPCGGPKSPLREPPVSARQLRVRGVAGRRPRAAAAASRRLTTCSSSTPGGCHAEILHAAAMRNLDPDQAERR